MQNIKYFYVIEFCLLSIIILTGCFGTKKDLTSDEFVSIVSKYGYKTFDELENSLGNDKVNVSFLKQYFDNFSNLKNAKHRIQFADIRLSSNIEISMISFVEFEDEKYAKRIISGYCDLRAKKKLGQLPLETDQGNAITNFEEISVGRAKRVIITGQNNITSNYFGVKNIFIIYSQVGKNVVQILRIGEDTKEINKILNELGF